MKSFSEKIVSLRRRHGLTQAELADKLGVTDKSVSKWERGISMPDLSVIAEISQLFGISTDILLGLKEEDMNGKFISLEKYLMGEFGYQVPDLIPSGADVVLLLSCPAPDDAAHGLALSGGGGKAAYEFLFEKDDFSYNSFSRQARLGAVYVSNVPLVSPSHELDSLVDELEYTRLGAMAQNRYLLEKFSEKMKRIIENEAIKTVTIENDFVKRYLGWFIALASPSLLGRMQERIATGSLKMLFVGPSRTWKRGEEKYDQAELKRTISK